MKFKEIMESRNGHISGGKRIGKSFSEFEIYHYSLSSDRGNDEGVCICNGPKTEVVKYFKELYDKVQISVRLAPGTQAMKIKELKYIIITKVTSEN